MLLLSPIENGGTVGKVTGVVVIFRAFPRPASRTVLGKTLIPHGSENVEQATTSWRLYVVQSSRIRSSTSYDLILKFHRPWNLAVEHHLQNC